MPQGELETAACVDPVPFSLLLREGRPTLPYRQLKSGALRARKDPLHWGQLKLLLGEVCFVSWFCDPGEDATVVYAGAAPGNHLVILAEMFPRVSFHLYDPREFFSELHKSPDRFVIHNREFSDADALEWSAFSEAFFLWSDVRTGAVEDRSSIDDNFEAHVEQNMKDQMRWVVLGNPRQAMLKFRLPYRPGSTEYLSGAHLLQPHAAATSTETRLITNARAPLRCFSHTEYEGAMFRFNAVCRRHKWAHGFSIRETDWDSVAAIAVAFLYLNSRHPSDVPEGVRGMDSEGMLGWVKQELATRCRRPEKCEG